MKKCQTASLFGGSLLLAIASCSAFAEVRVVTSIKPLQLIAAEIQDGVGEPEVLVPAGSSAHSHRPFEIFRLLTSCTGSAPTLRITWPKASPLAAARR